MKKRRLHYVLPWFVLACAYLLSVGFFALYGQHNLDADMSCEMIYADLLNQEGRLLTDSWYYSTEIRTVSPVPVFQLGLILFESWHAARTFAVAVCLLIVIAAFLYMASKLKLCAGGLYCASILALPFSQAYAYVTVFGCWYSIYLALVFVILGLLFRLDEKRERNRRLVILGLLSLWGGTAGIRMLMICAVPMMFASAMETLPELMKYERIADGVKGDHGVRFLGTVVVCTMTMAGYLYNELVLRKLYDFTDFGGTGIKLRNLDAFFEQVIGVWNFLVSKRAQRCFLPVELVVLRLY